MLKFSEWQAAYTLNKNTSLIHVHNYLSTLPPLSSRYPMKKKNLWLGSKFHNLTSGHGKHSTNSWPHLTWQLYYKKINQYIFTVTINPILGPEPLTQEPWNTLRCLRHLEDYNYTFSFSRKEWEYRRIFCKIKYIFTF